MSSPPPQLWVGWFALLTLGCGGPSRPVEAQSTKASRNVASNITRQDFVGSKACASCHPSIYDKWSRSPMHRMTRAMATGRAQAPFNGSRFRLGDDTASMLTRTGQHYMKLESKKYVNAWYRVTKVIGGRYREDYAGVRVSAPVPEARATGEERILPVSYLLFSNEWRYKGYSVMSPERDGLKRGLKWRKACVFCHNTAPWLSLHYDELYGVGAPGYQGSASLELPSDKKLAYRITDRSQFEAELAREFAELGAEPPASDEVADLLEEASEVTRKHFSEQHLVEIGIGCEACHGGGRAHIEDPGRVTPSYTPQSGFFTTTTKSETEVAKAPSISHSCAKCHTVLFSRYPYTWEGGDRGFTPGGSNMNSGEARNFLLGACTSQLTCSSCHDPHAEDKSSMMLRLESVQGNSVCTSCHSHLVDSVMLGRHTRHASDSKGSACIACHMPKKNVALDYDLTRYHRIGSPTDTERVEKDRPLECALCHADKSVFELVTSMERLWGKKFERKALRRLYGDNLEVNVLEATLRRGKPHEQVVAIHVSGKSRQEQSLKLLIQQLDHDYPLIRFFARDAVERISGRVLDVDMHQSGDEVKSAIERKLSQSGTDFNAAPKAAPSDAAH